MLPYIVALCPTFRRPALLANSVELWLRQTYPRSRRSLMILDDGGTFDPQHGDGWILVSAPDRYPSLPDKFNALAAVLPFADAYLVWEDDDCYLPSYIEAHARVLAARELSKPARVLSDYTGAIAVEQAAGRFHSTLGFRRELFERVGGWPATRRADFDQQFIARLESAAATAGDPFAALADAEIPYIYRWHTGQPHGQHAMRSPDDETWYDRAAHQLPSLRVGCLESKLDAATKRLLAL